MNFWKHHQISMNKVLKVALIQTTLAWEDPIANRQMFDKKIASVADSTDVIVLPEMFTTGFTMHPQNIPVAEGIITVDWMHEWASKKNAVLIGSQVFFEHEKYHNRLYFAKPNTSVSHYDKRHLFTLAGEQLVYERGITELIEEYKGFTFFPLICYDLRFPVWSRNTFDYDVLVYVANWPKPRISAWDGLLKARAIENMSYCIGVNRIGTDINGHEYSGHSAVYDTLGQQIAYSEKEEIVYATLNKEVIEKTRAKLGFLKDRDAFTLLP